MPEDDQAMTEASLITVSRQPPEFVARIRFDARHDHLLWDRLRRVYPLTLIGKELLGRCVARERLEADARGFEMVGDVALVKAVAELAAPDAPAFLEQSRELRRLLWPCTIQNPADEPGATIP